MSARDKKLLSVLVVIVVLALGYLFGYQPIVRAKEEVQNEINQYNTELTELRIHYDKMETYQKAIEDNYLLIEEIVEEFPADVEQERAFKLIFDIEESFEEIEFETLSFTETELLSSSNELNDETTLHSIRRTVTTAASLDYPSLKDFLEFIGNYPNRTVLNNLNLTLNEEEELIDVTISMNMYALAGSDRFTEAPVFDKVDYGKDIPFGSANIVWDEVKSEEVTYPSDFQEDLFITLKPITSDGYTHVIGKVVDTGERSYVQTEQNAMLNAIVRIYEENGSYYANYDIDGVYKERQEFDVETALEMVIFSSGKSEDTDNVGMNLTVYNQTETTLFIDVENDDLVDPRLNLILSQGEIVVK